MEDRERSTDQPPDESSNSGDPQPENQPTSGYGETTSINDEDSRSQEGDPEMPGLAGDPDAPEGDGGSRGY